MLQTLIVLFVIAIALVYCLWHFTKIVRGRGDCGCGKGAHCKNRHRPHPDA